MPETETCCKCCSSFILTLGFVSLSLWLSLGRPSKPTLSIEQLYLPALDRANTSNASTITFDLKLNNRNKENGIYYDPLNLTLYHHNNHTLPIANLTIPQFYQGFKKKAHRNETVEVVGVPWAAARREVAAGGGTVFRVDLKTQVRFRSVFWTTKRHGIAVSGNVTVNNMGRLVKEKKGIKLSGVSKQLVGKSRFVSGLVGFVFSFILF